MKAYAHLMQTLLKSNTDTSVLKQDKELSGSQLSSLSDLIRKAGFKSEQEFAQVNLEIAKAMSLIESALFEEKLNTMNREMKEDMMKQIREIQNPEMRAQFQKKIEEQFTRIQAANEKKLARDKEWAEWVLGKLRSVTSKHNAEIILKHYEQLTKIWTELNT